MENWREATRDWNFIMYSTEGYEEVSATQYINDISSIDEPHNGIDSEPNLSAVSQKRERFFGDNIRDAIKTIKG